MSKKGAVLGSRPSPDITRGKQTENASKLSVKRLKTLIEEVPVSICTTDIKGTLTYVNKTFEQVSGYSREEMVGKNGLKLGLFPYEALKLLRERMKGKLMGKPPGLLETQFKRKDGQWLWVEMKAKVLKEYGIPIGFQIVAQDITERKQAGEKLRESEEKYRRLFELSPIGITTLNMKGVITSCNPAVYKEGGYSEDEIVGKYFLKIAPVPVRNIPKYVRMFSSIIRGKQPKPFEIAYNRKDGTIGWTEVYVALLEADGKKLGVQVLQRDITERKRVEEALRRSEEKYSTLVERGNDGIIIVQDGVLTFVNSKMVEMTGFSLEEALGKAFVDFVSPEYRELVVDRYRKRMSGEEVPSKYEVEILGKDGRKISVEISASMIEYERRPADMAIIRDITERKRMEEALRGTQEQLVRSEKLAAIGQLAGGVGHELRNPLGAMKNAVYYIKGKVAKSELGQKEPRVMEFLDIVDDEINTSNKIISDLLGFSHVQRPSVSPTQIKKVIEDTLARIAIPENIELAKKLDADLPEVEIDPDQIHQVLVNMITNAVQAMPEGGKLTVGARENGGFLEVEVADTGCGIPEESVDKIFDPLFTTKARGIGLGLVVCKAIIDRHEGNIEVKSKVGKGTTFNVKLPLMREQKSNIGGK